MNLPIEDALIVWARVLSSDTINLGYPKKAPFMTLRAGYPETGLVIADDELDIAERIAKIHRRLSQRDSEAALAVTCKYGAWPGGRALTPAQRAKEWTRLSGCDRRAMYRRCEIGVAFISGAWDQ